MDASPSRQPWIDWLRFGAIAAVVLFHSAMPFANDFWLIQNEEKSQVLAELVTWLHRFRMPLLFFVSGTVSWYMLQKKTAAGFIRLRVLRLLIPLVFGMLVIVPPQIYLQRVNEGYAGSYFSFYPESFTKGTYPRGNFGWHHLWFIAYLLVYDIALAPVFKWLISPKGRAFLEKGAALSKGLRLYWLTLPSILLFASLSGKFPATDNLVKDFAFFPYWMLYVMAGFLCVAQPLFLQSIQRNRQSSLGIALLTTLLLHGLRWSNPLPDLYAVRFSLRFVSAVCAWSSVFALVGYGRKYLTRRTAFLEYINPALYPFYILHQMVLVWVAFYIVRFHSNVMSKYFLMLLLTVVISMTIYHFIIRPVPVLRLLFGMQQKKPGRPPTARKKPVAEKA